MRYSIRVVPNAKKPEVLVMDKAGTALKVKVDAKPEAGKANARLIEILSEHFSIPKNRIVLVSGVKSRDKIIEILC